MGCHPSHWLTHIFQDGYCTTNQLSIIIIHHNYGKSPFSMGKSLPVIWAYTTQPGNDWIFRSCQPSRNRVNPMISTVWNRWIYPPVVTWQLNIHHLPSGKPTKNYGKSPCLMGKSTINGSCSIAMLNYQRVVRWLFFFYNPGLELFSSGIFHDFHTFDFQNLPYLDPYLGIVEMTRI